MRYQTLYDKWDSAILIRSIIIKGFPGVTSGKEYSGQCRKHKRCWLDHWIRKIPGGGHGKLLQSSGLKNLMNSGAWWVTVLLLLLLLSHFSRVWLCATPQTEAHQAPPSLGFSRQEHWSGLPFPSPMHESEKSKWSCSVVSDSSWPHGLQPRLLRPWDFPGKSTGVGCHCPLGCK